MTDYDNACIYKIVLNGIRDEDFYIGSTINFNKRLNKHRQVALKQNYKLYKKIRANGGNFIMCKLYDFPCNNELELRIEERKAYDLYKPTLNTIRPYRTDDEKKQPKDYYKNHKEERNETSRKHYANNKEKINKRINEYKKNNKEKIDERQRNYYVNNKEKSQYYYENNKEKIRERQKEYYDNNKEKRNIKIICECGSICLKRQLKQHQRTKKHIEIMHQ